MLLYIQSLFNIIFLLAIKKTANEVTYSFPLYKLLNLLFDFLISTIFKTCIDTIDIIFFSLANQKTHYNQKYQLFSIKVGNWAMLRLHMNYSISFVKKVTKKPFQQYIGPFKIIEKVGQLVYKWDIP